MKHDNCSIDNEKTERIQLTVHEQMASCVLI